MKQLISSTILLFLLCFASCNTRPSSDAGENDGTASSPASVPVPEHKSNNSPLLYSAYCNKKLGFCVDYPSEILFPQGESANGDEQLFKSKDGENTLWVFKDLRDNIQKFTLRDAYEEDSKGNNPDIPNSIISYKKLGEDSYVLSGYNEGKIFHQKTILLNNQFITYLLQYNKSDQVLYNKIAENIFGPFK
ncbi:MAG TPA: hypothetical protein VK766_05085 [Cytophagaceae bacterium]|jgi:hypothetical protein|nr:hypothetical protein [Cytophagaceae bacterium]